MGDIQPPPAYSTLVSESVWDSLLKTIDATVAANKANTSSLKMHEAETLSPDALRLRRFLRMMICRDYQIDDSARHNNDKCVGLEYLLAAGQLRDIQSLSKGPAAFAHSTLVWRERVSIIRRTHQRQHGSIRCCRGILWLSCRK